MITIVLNPNIKGIRVVATLNQWEINLIQINN